MGQDSSFNGRKTRNYNTDANGIGDFRYTVPSGHLALCTANLPEEAMDPAINKDSPKNHFKPVTWTGDGSIDRPVAVGFQPDFIWVKNRDATDSHHWYDAVRGTDKLIVSNSNASESTTGTNYLTSFDADGMTVGSNGEVNRSGDDFVGFFMKMAGSSSSNTDGTITSTVSANQTAGMSIVSWTGNGTGNATVGHGLSQKPQFMMIKNLDQNHDWYIWSQMLPTGAQATLKQNDCTQPQDWISFVEFYLSRVNYCQWKYKHLDYIYYDAAIKLRRKLPKPKLLRRQIRCIRFPRC